MGNGVGPAWFPKWFRDFLTKIFTHYFNEASVEKHDEGYKRGSPKRAVCDQNYLRAMMRDAAETATTGKMFVCTFLAWTLWVATRLGGWTTYNKEGE